MPEEVKCKGCGSTHPATEHLGRVLTIKPTGKTVRVCSRCVPARQYDVTYEVEGSGSGAIRVLVGAASDHAARSIVKAKHKPHKVRILESKAVPSD